MGKITIQSGSVSRPGVSSRRTVDGTVTHKTVRPAQARPVSTAARSVQTKTTKPLTKEDVAARSAVQSVAHMNKTTPEPVKIKKSGTRHIFLALACSAITILLIGGFVMFNIPDISVKVAAMQTGIEATYPTFIPRNYTLSSVYSDANGTVTMDFAGPEDKSFTLTEEKSTWDSTALLNNYVKKTFTGNYSTLREQGITIYQDQADAVGLTWHSLSYFRS